MVGKFKRIGHPPSNNKIEVIDIKFEVAYISTYKTTYYAMIIYRDRQIFG